MSQGVSLKKNMFDSVRDWSLIMGRGATKREGGAREIYSYEKGGGGRKKF